MELHVSNFGATILSLKVPNKQKGLTEVVLGLSSPLDYLKNDYLEQNQCLGSSIGRFAGRISDNGFKIDGTSFELSKRNGQHLHGGFNGFDKRYWNFEDVERNENPSITLTYFSKHLEEGYPGNLSVSVTYQLTQSNELMITYEAQTDQATHVNLTNHAYFNLNGNGTIGNHELQIQSDKYLEIDATAMPTGEIVSSKDTVYDRAIQSPIGATGFSGFDNAFILNTEKSCATLYSEDTGIQMVISTNQPALVVYTPKTLKNLSFKEGIGYDDFPAICFEAQNFPDAPNHIEFPSSLLLQDEVYVNRTTFEFSLK